MFKELKYSYGLIQLLKDIEPSSGYPKTGLGNDLATISSIIGYNKPFKVFHLVHHGYDTHQWQAHRLNQLYNDLLIIKKYSSPYFYEDQVKLFVIDNLFSLRLKPN